LVSMHNQVIYKSFPVYSILGIFPGSAVPKKVVFKVITSLKKKKNKKKTERKRCHVNLPHGSPYILSDSNMTSKKSS